jgi:DNA modification methylase
MGSGQTAIAALETCRKYVGYELVTEDVRLADDRLGKDTSDLNNLLQAIVNEK